MDKAEAIRWLINLRTDIGKGEHRALWHYEQALSDIMELLHVPTIEPKQGEWIHSPNGIDRDFIWWKCSECGQVIYSETEEDRIEFHAYCGRCGAKMK